MLILCRLSRAVTGALAEYAEFLGAMSVQEAQNILGIPESQQLAAACIKKRAEAVRASNKKALPSAGYILQKICGAEKVLLREIE
ncbi:uncharacterized protein NEMAJ01_0283 [Nematocida major]|uniref:uncharacterized protein n=1 Tax=Nematocida major TaxID=1912982 RepID=UPI00200793C2|nr:uncharacterized protein NEMAJ01_0283 [Nematocida major]KAH9385387.1 hypothetical protein NEMAJ01_0283 [Nematocida major]